MRAFFRLVVQHLILLTVLVFVITGVLLRQQLFGLSSPVPSGPQAIGSAQPEAELPAPATETAGPPAPSADLTHPSAPQQEAPQEGPSEPAAPAQSDTPAPQALPGVPEPSVPSEPAVSPEPSVPEPPKEPSAGIAESAAHQAEPAASKPEHPRQVPQFLSGQPVSSSGYSFRPLDQPGSGASEPAVSGEGSKPEPVVTPSPSSAPATATETVGDERKVDTPEGAPAPQGSSPAQPPAKAARQDRLNEARHAFWDKDVRRAREIYEALAREEPDNPELLREVGNFYYQTGESEAAAQTYATAAAELLSQGRRAEAEELVETVRAMDPAKAADLGRRLGD